MKTIRNSLWDDGIKGKFSELDLAKGVPESRRPIKRLSPHSTPEQHVFPGFSDERVQTHVPKHPRV